MAEAVEPQFTRSCGNCTMCCKVYDVPPVDNKPRGKWCKHCNPGSTKGCKIWMDRPDFCRDFHCMWIRDETLGPEWKPDIAKFVMNYRKDLGVLNVMVDIGSPNAWRREPYFRMLQDFARRASAFKHIVQIAVGYNIIILTPDREFDMGRCEDDLEHTWNISKSISGETLYTLVNITRKQNSAAA